jgi:hypothetical protein
MDVDIFGYNDKINLETYLGKKEEEFKKLEEEISTLREIKIPVSIRFDKLYSSDYSKAEDFSIEHKTKKVNGFHNCDGGYDINETGYYPQFFFTIKTSSKSLQVLVQHEGFENDERIIFKKHTYKIGDDYETSQQYPINQININRAFSFFKDKGVNYKLLEKFRRRMLNLVL